MRAGRARAAWDPARKSRVPEYSQWKRRHPTRDTKAEVWKVTARYRFEAGGNGELLAVRLHCFGGASAGRTRHMSEARFLRLFVPFDSRRGAIVSLPHRTPTRTLRRRRTGRTVNAC